MLLRTGTVRGPAVAVSSCARMNPKVKLAVDKLRGGGC